MTDPNVQNFNPGGLPDRLDPRDYKWSEIGFGSSPFDWNVGFDVEIELSSVLGIPNFKLPVKDQNGSGSCGGQAWSTLDSVIEAFATKTFEERSAKFIYSQTYYPYGGGSTGRDNSDILVKQGCCIEPLCVSYNAGNPPTETFITRPQDITDSARINAKNARALSYANTEIDIDMMAQVLRDNKGFVIGITGSNNGTWSSAFPKPPKLGDLPWGHWIYVGKAKIIDGKKHLGVLNSWGTAVGEQGWQWISEDYFKAPIVAFRVPIMGGWTLIYNPDPVSGFNHNFVVQLQYGQNGVEVAALQKALQIDGEFPASVPATGYYGDITRRAVLDFQIKYKIAPLTELIPLAGKVVGPKTRAQLNKLFN